MPTPEKWQVYYLFCHHTKPYPKNKYVVVVYVDIGFCLGFLINSRINQFIQERDHLLPCEVLIEHSQHLFLAYDSYVDCQEAFNFSIPELNDLKGTITFDAQNRILTGVRNCPVLRKRHKNLILS